MEEKTTSLFDLPTDITKKEIPPHLSVKDLSRLARTCKGAQILFASALTDATLLALLQHVAFGEQAEAESILKKEPALLLKLGQVTDHSGRTFEDITAFQYALWALDRHMWRMILNYLPTKDAKMQLHDHVHNKKAYKEMHGDYFDFVPLTDALQTYDTNFGNWSTDQRIKQWCEVVWGTQFLVPAHVANEYCRADRSFYPLPKFKEDNTLPRTLIIYDETIPGKSCWFARHAQGARREAGGAGRCSWPDVGPGVGFDLAAVTALGKVRTEEFVELKQQLLNPAQAPKKLNHPPKKSSCVIS